VRALQKAPEGGEGGEGYTPVGSDEEEEDGAAARVTEGEGESEAGGELEPQESFADDTVSLTLPSQAGL
jgi:hypothetical protein